MLNKYNYKYSFTRKTLHVNQYFKFGDKDSYITLPAM